MREPTSQADAKNLVVAALVLNEFLTAEDKISLIKQTLAEEIDEVAS